MKKKLGILVICLITIAGMMSLTSCGDTEEPYSGYDLDEYIKVADYKGLYVDKKEVSVSKKEIRQEIASAREAAAEDVELEQGTKLKNGDTANIDYTGRIDGKKFEGGSAQGHDLKLGSGEFIPGFEDGLIGKRVGDKKVKVEVTFPEDYNAEQLQGKAAVFTVNVNSATRARIPAYDKAFVKSQGDFNNKKQYEKAIKENIKTRKREEAVNKQKEELWDKVVGDSKVKKYPQEEVDHYMEFNDQQMSDLAEEYGVTRSQVLAQYGFADEKAFDLSNAESSKLRVKQELIILKIAEDEELSYTDEEKDEMITQFEGQGYTEENILQQTGRTMDEYVDIQLLYKKVLDLILDKANIK
ncbi:MAG: trigger factor [Bacillota bacterium]|nr:trigger factor [Bacillota bacterium]